MFVPIVSKPGTSIHNKTGTWRVKQKPKFLQQNCIACNMCFLICPEGCISGEGKNTYKADYDYCKGCGLCAYICPKNDIVMVDEKEDVK
ncbi:MAG: pyruvate synthase [Candidatus Omnitrophota bacterium]|nr:MAG: pyruvate synthase [Candidatus Omnitrophota bacterium]